MTTIIGMVLPDGRVKYIKCEGRATIADKARILTRFYARESRANALMELGNLYELGPSPYGVSGGDDKVHCAAMIRDLKHNEDEERAQVIDNKEIFLGATHPAFLFEDGKWFLVHDGELSSPHDIPAPRRKLDRFKLCIIRTSRHIGRMQKDEMDFTFEHWDEMVRQAEADDDTCFVFSDRRLIATINPKPIQL